MVKRGVFFSIDATIATVLIISVLVIIPMFYVKQEEDPQIMYFSSDIVQSLSKIKVGEIDDAAVRELLNNSNVTDYNRTIMEQVLRFKVAGDHERAEKLMNLTTRDVIPGRVNFGFWVEGYDDPVFNNTLGRVRQLISAKALVSGIEREKAIEGFTSRVFLSELDEKISAVYSYFGGYVGNGNITKKIVLPWEISSVNSFYIEMRVVQDFDLFVNNAFVGRFNATNQTAEAIPTIIEANTSFFHAGDNYVTVAFHDIQDAYIGGGFIRVGYTTSNLYDKYEIICGGYGSCISYGGYEGGNIITETFWLPEIDGVINLYSSFFVQGLLKSMKVYLDYAVNPAASVSTFFNIGNTTVYQHTGVGTIQRTISNYTLSNLLNYTEMSKKTIPFRFGLAEKNISTSDVVLVTDTSNSMRECMDSREIRPDQDTLLLLHFDSMPLQDSSGWNRTVNVSGALGLDTGVIGSSAEFTGSQFIRIEDDLGDPEAMTIEFWMRKADWNQGSQYLLDARADGNWWYLQDYVSSNCPEQGNICWYARVQSPSAYLKNDKWQHIAVTVNKTESQIYVDGHMVGTGGGRTIQIGKMLYIGYRYSESCCQLRASMDELAIHKRILTDREIMSHAMALNQSSCPDDGIGDMPDWCRYETSHCPPERPVADEAYAPEAFFDAPDFEKIVYSDRECLWMDNCSTDCPPSHPYSNGSLSYDTLVECGAAACPAGFCPDGQCFHEYKDCAWYQRDSYGDRICDNLGLIYGYDENGNSVTSFSLCRPGIGSCNASEKDWNAYYCNCVYRDKPFCGAPDECLPGEEIYYPIFNDISWRPYDPGDPLNPTCLASECYTGQTRYGAFYCTEEASCDPGYVSCSECSLCSGLCCCDETTLEYECEQEEVRCCTETRCYTYMDYCCGAILCSTDTSNACCDTEDHCKGATENTEQCIPGLSEPIGERYGCSGEMCIAENGSCYICDSVRIRLAKKLDREFVDEIILGDKVQLGLVRYGTGVTSATNLSLNRTMLYEEIEGYHADSGLTCLSCAIERSASILINNGTAEKRYIVLMTDGEANVCLDGSECGEAAIEEAINLSENISKEYDITIYTKGFGSDAGSSTLAKIANVSNGKFYKGSNAEDLALIYSTIAYEIAYESQVINLSLSSNVSSVIRRGSYIEFVYQDIDESLDYSVIPLTLETPRFNNNQTKGSFFVPSESKLLEAKVTSYSDDRWASYLGLLDTGYIDIFNLSEMSYDYHALGDPFIISIPVSYTHEGENQVWIQTGSGAVEWVGGSPADRAIYTLGIKINLSYSGVFSKAEGCNWSLMFEDGQNISMMIPASYNGTKDCNFTDSTDCGAEFKDDAVNDAMCRLFQQLDFDDDGRLFAKFGPSDLDVETVSIGKIPFMWGPTVVEARVWR